MVTPSATPDHFPGLSYDAWQPLLTRCGVALFDAARSYKSLIKPFCQDFEVLANILLAGWSKGRQRPWCDTWLEAFCAAQETTMTQLFWLLADMNRPKV